MRFGISVFSVHPGLLPIGLGEPSLLEQGPSDRYFSHIRDWVMREFDEGRGADPTCAIDLMLRIARGDADLLSGRHIDVYDDLDAMVREIDAVRGNDLYVLKPERPDQCGRARKAG